MRRVRIAGVDKSGGLVLPRWLIGFLVACHAEPDFSSVACRGAGHSWRSRYRNHVMYFETIDSF